MRCLRKSLVFACLSLLLVVVVGCGGAGNAVAPPIASPPEQLPAPAYSADWEYKDDVVVIEDNGLIQLASQLEGEEIVLRGLVPDIAPGQVILSRLEPTFLGRATSVERSGSEVRIEAVNASLQDLFKWADIHVVHHPAAPTLAQIVPAEGVRIHGVQPAASIDPGAYTLPFDFALTDGSGRLAFEGSITLHPSISLDVDTEWCTVWDTFGLYDVDVPCGVELSSRLDAVMDIDIETTVEREFEVFSKEKKICTINLPGFWAGPVYVTPKIEVKIGAEASLAPGVTIGFTVDDAHVWVGGSVSTSADCSPAWGYGVGASGFTRPKVFVRGEAFLYTSVQPTLYIYGVAGPCFIVDAGGCLEAIWKVSQRVVELEAKPKVRAGIGFNTVKILGFKPKSYRLDRYELEFEWAPFWTKTIDLERRPGADPGSTDPNDWLAAPVFDVHIIDSAQVSCVGGEAR